MNRHEAPVSNYSASPLRLKILNYCIHVQEDQGFLAMYMTPIPLTESHSWPASPMLNGFLGLSLEVRAEHPLRVLGSLQFRIPVEEMETSGIFEDLHYNKEKQLY